MKKLYKGLDTHKEKIVIGLVFAGNKASEIYGRVSKDRKPLSKAGGNRQLNHMQVCRFSKIKVFAATSDLNRLFLRGPLAPTLADSSQF